MSDVVTIPYKPQDYQRDWHNCLTRFLVLVAGRQVGKTTAIFNDAIRFAVSNPNTRTWYVTNDYAQAKRNVWDTFKKYIIPQMGAQFNSSELKITFPNGSKIELIGVENAESLRGAVVHRMYLDEYADFPRQIWPKVLRPMLSTTAGKVWFVGTPKGMGNDLYDKYFADEPDTTKYKLPSATVKDGQIIATTSFYADKSEIESAYANLPKDAFDQEYLADFTRPSGTVYSEWPLENFKKVDYDANLDVHITLDFGVNDPTSVVWIQNNGSEVRVIDYYEASDANIEHFVQVIRSKPYKEPSLITGDPAGKSRTLTTGTSPIEIMAQKGLYVRTKDGVKIPDQIRAVHSFAKSLFVSDKLTRFRDCLLNYRYPEIKDTARNQENEIPIHDEFCLAGKTLIRTLDGWRRIDSLVGKQFYVWGYSEIEKKLVPTLASKCWKAKENAKTIEIGLDDGHSITCTPEHKFMLRNGDYKEASQLSVNDSLMPFYEYNQSGYVGIHLNDGSKGLEHHLVYNRLVEPVEPHYHIHHISDFKDDNRPDNLEALHPTVHCSKTFAGLSAEERKRIVPPYIPYSSNNLKFKNCLSCDREFLADHKTFYCSQECYNAGRRKRFGNRWNDSEEYRSLAQASNRKYEEKNKKECPVCGETISRKAERCYKHRYNHKVRYIRPSQSCDVYDIEVPETHNFVAEGVVVHNCHAMRSLEYYAVNVKGINQFRKRKQIVGYHGGDPITGYGRVPIYE